MERRDMLKKIVGASVVLGVTPLHPVLGKAGEWVKYEQYKLIDERLSGKLTFDCIQDGEAGYVYSQNFINYSKEDKKLYFVRPACHDAFVFTTESDSPVIDPIIGAYPQTPREVFIYIKNNHCYVNLTEHFYQHTLAWYEKDPAYGQTPANIALGLGYPLEKQENGTNKGFFAVPLDLEEMKKNPHVINNAQALKEGIEETKRINEKYALAHFYQWTHGFEQENQLANALKVLN